MEIGLDPSVHLGPLTIAWHGIFTAVGIFFGVALPVRLLRGMVSEDDAYAVATWGVVSGIVGARLVHVVDTWAYYAQHPEQILMIWTGGIAIWGAVIGGAVGGYVVALRRGVRIGHTADAAAPGIGLGLALGRIGDIINGEHHATACEPPFGICVRYTHPDTLGQSDLVHLAVAYDMVWVGLTVAAAVLLWRARERGALRIPDGAIFWGWMISYGVGRFAVSFLRINDPQSIFGLRQDQLIGLTIVAVGVGMLARLLSRRAPRTAPA